jgi:hypothetical protein
VKERRDKTRDLGFARKLSIAILSADRLASPNAVPFETETAEIERSLLHAASVDRFFPIGRSKSSKSRAFLAAFRDNFAEILI